MLCTAKPRPQPRVPTALGFRPALRPRHRAATSCTRGQAQRRPTLLVPNPEARSPIRTAPHGTNALGPPQVRQNAVASPGRPRPGCSVTPPAASAPAPPLTSRSSSVRCSPRRPSPTARSWMQSAPSRFTSNFWNRARSRRSCSEASHTALPQDPPPLPSAPGPGVAAARGEPQGHSTPLTTGEANERRAPGMIPPAARSSRPPPANGDASATGAARNRRGPLPPSRHTAPPPRDAPRRPMGAAPAGQRAAAHSPASTRTRRVGG